MKGFIKLPRDFVEWEWWGRVPHHFLFEWLLIKAKVHDQKVAGVMVRRGSVLTTWTEMQAAVDCSVGSLSRALKDLSECGEITTRTERRKTIVTICHYEDYNGNDNELWSDSGVIAERKRSEPPLYKGEQENENNIYSAYARESLEDGFVTDADCRLWMARYNKIAVSFGAPVAEQLNTKRQMYIAQRVREKGRGSIDTMFKQLEQSAYFFGDGSRGFRGDFTNLWTADVFTKVCEGYYIPKKKDTGGAPDGQVGTKGLSKAASGRVPAAGAIDAHVGPKQQSREEWMAQMRKAAKENPEGRIAKIVASWDQAEQK